MKEPCIVQGSLESQNLQHELSLYIQRDLLEWLTGCCSANPMTDCEWKVQEPSSCSVYKAGSLSWSLVYPNREEVGYNASGGMDVLARQGQTAKSKSFGLPCPQQVWPRSKSGVFSCRKIWIRDPTLKIWIRNVSTYFKLRKMKFFIGVPSIFGFWVIPNVVNLTTQNSHHSPTEHLTIW